MSDDHPYREPKLYDLEYADYDEDIQFYASLARRWGRSVLELGCGTGRLTLPLAATGARVYGIDAAPTMLTGLTEKLADAPADVASRVRYAEGDFRTLDLGETFSLVILPFNAIHHCADLDEVNAMLQAVKRHLAPNGLFAFDLYLTDLALYDRDPNQRFEERTFIDPRTGTSLHSWEQGWWDAERCVHHVVYTYAHLDGTEERVHLALRMFERDEIKQALADAGLNIRREASDFTGRAMHSKALKWVLVTTRGDESPD